MPQAQLTDFDDLGFQPEGNKSTTFDDLGFVQEGAPSTAKFPAKQQPDLKAQHAANVKAGAAAYKPGWLESYQLGGLPFIQSQMMGAPALSGAMEAIAGAPKRFAETIMGAPAFVRDVLTGKGAQIGTQMIQGMTEPLMSPRTTGEAIAGGAADAALMGMIGKTAGVMTRGQQAAGKAIGTYMAPSSRATRAAEVGTNQVVAGLHPKNIKTARAVKSARADINDYLVKSGRDFTDSATFRDVVGEAADDFYVSNYKPLADSLNGIPVEHQGALRPFEQLIERRGEINKTLGRLGYFDKSPLARSLARTQPQVQKLVEELDELKGSLNTAVDQLAPTNEGAAKILRRYADMKEVSDVAKTQADRIELAKMIESGQAEPLGARAMGWLKDAGITAATAGLNPRLFNRWWNMLTKNLDPTLSSAAKREIQFARGAKNWSKGRSAMAQEHRPITRTSAPQPAPQPTPQVAPNVTPAVAPQAPTQQPLISPQAHRAPPVTSTTPTLLGLTPERSGIRASFTPGTTQQDIQRLLADKNVSVEKRLSSTSGEEHYHLTFFDNAGRVVQPPQDIYQRFGSGGSFSSPKAAPPPTPQSTTAPVTPPAPTIAPVPEVTSIGGGQYNLNIGGGQQTFGQKAGETVEDAVRRTQQHYANAPAVRQHIKKTGLPPGVRAEGRSMGEDLYAVDTAEGTFRLKVGAGENFVQKLQQLWEKHGRLD